MRKYLKKLTVIYRFKLEILADDEHKDLDEAGKHQLWEIYLESLMESRMISPYQAATWKYPTEELK